MKRELWDPEIDGANLNLARNAMNPHRRSVPVYDPTLEGGVDDDGYLEDEADDSGMVGAQEVNSEEESDYGLESELEQIRRLAGLGGP